MKYQFPCGFVNLTIFETAIMSGWQHHFLYTSSTSLQSMVYQFLFSFENLYDYFLNSYFVLLVTSFLAYKRKGFPKYKVLIPQWL
jgi:hypothetical protein